MSDREIRYRFSATETVSRVAERVEKALKGARKSSTAEALEEIGKLGKGAGAVAGVELVAQGLEKAADAMKEFREASERGTLSWGNYVDVIARSIPVIGGVYSAVRKLRFGKEEEDDERKLAASEALRALAETAFTRSATANKEGIDLQRAQARTELSTQIKAIEDVRQQNKKGLTRAQNEQLNEIEARVKKEGKENLLKIERDYYEKQSKIIEDGEAKIREMKAGNAAAIARYAGMELQARLIEIRSQRDQQLRSIKESFDAQIKAETDPARLQRLFAARGQQAAEAERQRRLSEDQAQEDNRNVQNQKRFDIASKGLEFLQKEGELGNIAAAKDAERLSIIQEYAKKRQEITDLLAKENDLTANEKDLLKNQLAGLGEQEKTALSKLGIAKVKFSGGTAPTEESSFLTGVAASGRENDPINQVAKSSAAMEKHLASIREDISKIAKTPAAFVVK